MKTKRLVILGICAAFLIAVVAAIVNAVFTVSAVEVRYQTFSESGRAEAAQLQQKLDETFLGKSTTFLNLDDVKEETKAFSHFRVEKLEKKYPGTVALSVTEREETFAYLRENGTYAILDQDGTFLYDSEENVNREGGENVLLSGFALTVPSSGEGVTGSGFAALLKVTESFRLKVGAVRANIRSVELTERKIEGEYFRMQMNEGVVLEIHLPQNNTEEKAEALAEAYLELTEVQKTYGYLDIIDLGNGEFHKPVHREEIYLENN